MFLGAVLLGGLALPDDVDGHWIDEHLGTASIGMGFFEGTLVGSTGDQFGTSDDLWLFLA